MSDSSTPEFPVAGQSFRDRDGQRWWVSGRRPGTRDQFIIEQEMKGSYLRVAVHVMTGPEFRACASDAQLKAERPGRERRAREA
jgi:hypothetical protein